MARNASHPGIYGYEYRGYAKRIHSLKSYYEANMDMLNLDNWKAVYRPDRKNLHQGEGRGSGQNTWRMPKSPTPWWGTDASSKAPWKNSILFRRVRVGRNAVVKNSIIMQNTVIGEEAGWTG